MKKIINVTSHVLNFRNDDGTEFVVEPWGIAINAMPQEEIVKQSSGITFVTTKFVGNDDNEQKLADIEQKNPGAIIVGSMLAAQAFPGRVVVVTPAPGFERVPPPDKRMNPNKFTVFSKEEVVLCPSCEYTFRPSESDEEAGLIRKQREEFYSKFAVK